MNEEIMKLFKKYLGSIYISVAWTLMVLILLTLPGSMLPDESTFKIPQFDKFVHVCLFGGLVFLWCLHISTRPMGSQKRLLLFFYIFILGVALGISMEFVQKYFIPFREFELGDIIADMIGAGLAYGISNVGLFE